MRWEEAATFIAKSYNLLVDEDYFICPECGSIVRKEEFPFLEDYSCPICESFLD